MTKPEILNQKSNVTNFEIFKTPDGQRISAGYHKHFSDYYRDVHRNIVNLLKDEENEQTVRGKRFPIGYSNIFSDGSSFYAVLERDNRYKSDAVIAPIWLAPSIRNSIWDAVGAACEIGDAFTKSAAENESVLTDRLIAVIPYAELRQDKNTPRNQRTYWNQESRESNTSRIMGNTLATNGISEAIFNHPHSREGLQTFNDLMETICLTPTPLFAEWLYSQGHLDDSDIVSPDEGGAQQAHHLAQLTNRNLIVFKKDRPEPQEISRQDLIVGKPQSKDAIIIDDLASSNKSTLTTAESCIKLGYEGVVLCIPHAVFSGAYLNNIQRLQNLGVVKDFAITNSLPKAEDAPFMPLNMTVIPIEEMLAFFAKYVALFSIPQVKADPEWNNFIITPRNKYEVVEELRAIYK